LAFLFFFREVRTLPVEGTAFMGRHAMQHMPFTQLCTKRVQVFNV
jgi:hypothetical protein